MGFGFGFGMFGVMLTLMFILVFGIFLVTIVRGIGQWNKNNNSPRLTVPATVVSKRSHTSHHHHNTGGHHHTTIPPATTLHFRWTAVTGWNYI